MIKPHLTILGGGPAGLSVGYFAKENNIPFTIYEASNNIGGNARTLKFGDFLVDSGAHRLHDQIPEVTSEIKKLLGKDLRLISIPTQIYYNEKLVDFPLSPLNLYKRLGPITFANAALQVLKGKINPRPKDSFEDFALDAYGKIIAGEFLLNYSEKLWGRPCNELSPNIAGKRLKGLNLKTLIVEAILGSSAKTTHLDGGFYYPKYGIGMICERLAKECGEKNIKLNSPVTKVKWKSNKIRSIEIANRKNIDTDILINTTPTNIFVSVLEPTPKGVKKILESLEFRDIKLAILTLNTKSVTNSATVHFPDVKYPFTRAYEPRNRSPHMSPKGKTSIVVEFPYQRKEKDLKDEYVIETAIEHLAKEKIIKKEWVIDSFTHNLDSAYPILEKGFDEKVKTAFKFFNKFSNLYISGRSGRFAYSWIHNQIDSGRKIGEEIAKKHT
jgi:protoporphyrinogen oxidase